MATHYAEIQLSSKGEDDMIDITEDVQKVITESKLKEGIACVFVPGSTGSLTTIEFEPGLLADFRAMWERNVPQDIPYDHDRRWGDGNGYSHVRASLLGPSLVIPFTSKRLTLGTWQQVIVVDFDNRPRSRQVIVQILGE